MLYPSHGWNGSRVCNAEEDCILLMILDVHPPRRRLQLYMLTWYSLMMLWAPLLLNFMIEEREIEPGMQVRRWVVNLLAHNDCKCCWVLQWGACIILWCGRMGRLQPFCSFFCKGFLLWICWAPMTEADFWSSSSRFFDHCFMEFPDGWVSEWVVWLFFIGGNNWIKHLLVREVALTGRSSECHRWCQTKPTRSSCHGRAAKSQQ